MKLFAPFAALCLLAAAGTAQAAEIGHHLGQLLGEARAHLGGHAGI